MDAREAYTEYYWVKPDPDWELDSDNTYTDEDFEE